MNLGRLLPWSYREPNPDAIRDPSSAQFHLWLAQIRRDHGYYSDHEMAKIESIASMPAQRSVTMFNPFTGELRQSDPDDRPTTVFLGAL